MNEMMRNKINKTKKYLTLFICCILLTPSVHSENERSRMCQDLDIIRHILDIGYAPATWKNEHFQWDLDQALNEAKGKVILAETFSTKQFQQVVKQFLNTTRDHHVGAHFISTESASLPFSVICIDGRYYVDWVDSEYPSISHMINLGDEVISFDDQSLQDIVDEYRMQNVFQSNPQTDQSLNDLYITRRTGMNGDDVPRGPVHIVFKSAKDAVLRTHQFMWDYTSEVIPPLGGKSSSEKHITYIFSPEYYSKKRNKDHVMINPLMEGRIHPMKDKLTKGYLPRLGKLLSDESVEPFNAYVYQNEEGRSIGYIRIATYKSDTKKAKVFGEIIGKLQEKTDALVIDQLNNHGGGLLYLYYLLSYLTDYSLVTPKHCFKISQDDVFRSHRILAELQGIENDKDFKAFIKEKKYSKELYNPFFFKNYNYVLFLRQYHDFIISEWNKGKTFTAPTHVDGVDYINPHPKYRYTKPILVLINELNFSAADLFAAVIKDNNRGLLFGTRTAGAGGCLAIHDFPNCNGIYRIAYTSSIALRPDGFPIEDLGVYPDIEYQITKEDLQNDYKYYIQAVNHAISGLLQ